MVPYDPGRFLGSPEQSFLPDNGPLPPDCTFVSKPCNHPGKRECRGIRIRDTEWRLLTRIWTHTHERNKSSSPLFVKLLNLYLKIGNEDRPDVFLKLNNKIRYRKRPAIRIIMAPWDQGKKLTGKTYRTSSYSFTTSTSIFLKGLRHY